MAKTEEEVKAEAAAEEVKAAEATETAETAKEAKAEASDEESKTEASDETLESTETEKAEATEGEEEATAEEAAEEAAPAEEVPAEAESAEASEEKTEDKAEEAVASEDAEEVAEAAPEAVEEAPAEEAPAEEAPAEEAEATDKTEATEALVEAEAADKSAFTAKMKEKLKCSMASEDIDALELDLTDEEKALASEKSFAEIVKMAIAVSNELKEVHAAKTAAEANANGEARYKELAEKGLAFVGEKAKVQKEKVGTMKDAAFASYIEDLIEIKASLGSSEGFDKTELEKAKANVGAVSQEAEVNGMSQREKYAKLMA